MNRKYNLNSVNSQRQLQTQRRHDWMQHYVDMFSLPKGKRISLAKKNRETKP